MTSGKEPELEWRCVASQLSLAMLSSGAHHSLLWVPDSFRISNMKTLECETFKNTYLVYGPKIPWMRCGHNDLLFKLHEQSLLRLSCNMWALNVVSLLPSGDHKLMQNPGACCFGLGKLLEIACNSLCGQACDRHLTQPLSTERFPTKIPNTA